MPKTVLFNSLIISGAPKIKLISKVASSLGFVFFVRVTSAIIKSFSFASLDSTGLK